MSEKEQDGAGEALVEAVARAIKSAYDAQMQQEAAADDSAFDFEPGPWQEWECEARAAIAALQSRPTEPAVDKIQAVAEGVANIVGAPYEDWRHFTGEAKAILARLETAAEPAGDEPVAEKPFGWFYEGPAGQNRFHRQEMSIPKRWTETPLYARPAPSNPDRLVEAVRTTIARCEALEDEASNELVKADDEHAQGYWRGQKRTAKSIRRELHNLTRAALSAPALNGEKGE